MGVFCRRWGVPLIDGGTIRLPRVIGMGRALDLILTGRAVGAEEALAMGLVNAVVPHGELDTEVQRWCDEIAERSPTAIAIAKRSFNADSENIRGIGALGMQALALYYQSEESKEGAVAFREKRKPQWSGK